MDLTSSIAWIGSTCFSLSALPQAWMCYKTKSADGLSWLFLMLWFVGEVCMLGYSAYTLQYPLLTNYLVNWVVLQVILYYKISGKSASK